MCPDARGTPLNCFYGKNGISSYATIVDRDFSSINKIYMIDWGCPELSIDFSFKMRFTNYTNYMDK